jgi:hypothetical protein
MRVVLVLALCLAGSPGWAQDDVVLERSDSRWRVGFETLDLDGSDEVGLVGVHWDVFGLARAFPPLYLGLGGFGQVTGDGDGLFLGGVTLGSVLHPGPGWVVDGGVFLGAGSLADEADGEGWAARPFLALERLFGTFGLRTEVAWFDVDGLDEEVTLSLGFSLSSELLRARTEERRGERRGERDGEIPEASVFDVETRVEPRFLVLDPESGTTRDDGTPLTDDIELAGLGIDYFVTRHVYVPVSAYGAVDGGVDGFRMVGAGIGVSLPVLGSWLSVEAEASALTGGGGDVDTGGSLGYQALAGLRLRVLKDLAVEVSAGRLDFPGGDLEADAWQAALSWSLRPVELAFDYPRGNLAREGLPGGRARVGTTRVEVLSKLYSPRRSALRKDGKKLESTLALAGIGVEQPLNEHLSVYARAFGAVDGGIGGYSEGLLGVRVELSPFDEHWFGITGAAGAAGGGNLDVGDGLLLTWAGSWRHRLTDALTLGAEWGRAEARDSTFDAEAITIGLGLDVRRAFGRE